MTREHIEKALSDAGVMNKKLDDFGDLLDSISNLTEKRKFLWKEIFYSAMSDRAAALMMFQSALQTMDTSSSVEHINMGPILTRYLEKMSKANDQLIKLAELIRPLQEESQIITSDDIFSKIAGG